MSQLLAIEGVSFRYGHAPPLFQRITLGIAPGEMVGLLGPNGSGKTTLLKLATGVLTPQEGRVLLGGHDLLHLRRRAIAQRVAVVPQELSVPFAFTVRQMVFLGRTPHLGFLGAERARDRRAVERALAATNTAALADRVFTELSGGERQRVIVAMALSQEPELLLLDEPTAHLDIKHQVEVLALVRQLNRERGVTVLAALHDLNLAARYFDRLVLFQRGVIADGSSATVLEERRLSRVYDTPVQVGILRGAAHISVLPPGSATEAAARCAGTALVHVIGGGGAAELPMRALADAGIPFSAGAFNVGDSDDTLASRLATRVVREEPWSAISPARLAEVRDCLAIARAQILAPIPIGWGNVALLRLVLAAARDGMPTCIYQPGGMLDRLLEQVAERDYTGGVGTELIAELMKSGACTVDDLHALVVWAQEIARAAADERASHRAGL